MLTQLLYLIIGLIQITGFDLYSTNAKLSLKKNNAIKSNHRVPTDLTGCSHVTARNTVGIHSVLQQWVLTHVETNQRLVANSNHAKTQQLVLLTTVTHYTNICWWPSLPFLQYFSSKSIICNVPPLNHSQQAPASHKFTLFTDHQQHFYCQLAKPSTAWQTVVLLIKPAMSTDTL